jgi:hypothetical protein
MKVRQLTATILLGVMFFGAGGLGSASSADVREKVQRLVEPFQLTQVRLLDGPFQRAMELDHRYLLSLDPERLLHNFRVNAGLPSQAKPLGGWEEPNCEVRGHFVGHYLSACALMFASTGDQRLKDRAAVVVAGLAQCQEKMGTGYLSAFPETFIDRVEACKPVWAPWYTLHKIYAGLLDVHRLCGNRQALEVARKAADWIKSRTDRLSDQQMQNMLGNEHGGMNEVLAELAAVTGQEQYLRLARRFNHHAVLDPLARREDRLTGLHANTQFPKVIGAARQYELTGEASLRTTATFFWNVVTKERSYVIGGNSDYESFSPKEELSKHVGPSTTETCNTYNMLKLTRKLFCWCPKAEYADYYERALYNHILASQNPETGMMCYYVPLKTGSAKVFNTPNDSFWCCTGTGVENHAKYGDSIYFHAGTETLYVNLFIASELSWRQAGLTLRQETKYPFQDTTRLTFTCDKPISLNLKIRHPAWALGGFDVRVNGTKQELDSTPGSYASLPRQWRSGDCVEVHMPMSLRTEAFRDDPRKLAILYGPLVLCSEVDPRRPFPVAVAEPKDLLAGIRPLPDKPLWFRGSPEVFRILGAASQAGVVFQPFFPEHEKPYVVYWDLIDEAQWNKRLEAQKAAEARQKTLAARTTDWVRIGDASSEAEHGLRGERHASGEFNGRSWRHAPGGWFSYEMKTSPDQPVELTCTYWGSDVGRRFDILIDGHRIATQKLEQNRPDAFFDEIYAIPPELTRGKGRITVRFQAQGGSTAGGLFECRLLRK